MHFYVELRCFDDVVLGLNWAAGDGIGCFLGMKTPVPEQKNSFVCFSRKTGKLQFPHEILYVMYTAIKLLCAIQQEGDEVVKVPEMKQLITVEIC